MTHFAPLTRFLMLSNGRPGRRDVSLAPVALKLAQCRALYGQCLAYATQSKTRKATNAKVKQPPVTSAAIQSGIKLRKKSISAGKLDVVLPATSLPTMCASKGAKYGVSERSRKEQGQLAGQLEPPNSLQTSRKSTSKRRGYNTEPIISPCDAPPVSQVKKTSRTATSSSSSLVSSSSFSEEDTTRATDPSTVGETSSTMPTAEVEQFREDKMMEADVRHAIRMIMSQHLNMQRVRQRAAHERMAEERELIEKKFSASRERIEAKTINSMRLLGSDTSAVGEGIVPLFARAPLKQSRDSHGWAYGRWSDGDRRKGAATSAWMMPNPVGLSAAAKGAPDDALLVNATHRNLTASTLTKSPSLNEQYTAHHSQAARAQHMSQETNLTEKTGSGSCDEQNVCGGDDDDRCDDSNLTQELNSRVVSTAAAAAEDDADSYATLTAEGVWSRTTLESLCQPNLSVYDDRYDFRVSSDDVVRGEKRLPLRGHMSVYEALRQGTSTEETNHTSCTGVGDATAILYDAGAPKTTSTTCSDGTCLATRILSRDGGATPVEHAETRGACAVGQPALAERVEGQRVRSTLQLLSQLASDEDDEQDFGVSAYTRDDDDLL